MVSRKSKRRRPDTLGKSIEGEETHNDSPPPSAFQALFSDLQSPKGISPSVLNRCYLLLNHLSSIPPCTMRMGHGAELNDCNEETGNDCHHLVMDDIVRVSDLLFKELSERFEKCFSSLSHGDYSSASDQRDSFGIVNLLLRCCLLFLTLPEINQEYLFQKGQILLGILRHIRSTKFKEKKLNQGIGFEGSISSTCGDVDAGYGACSTEDFIQSLHFLEPSQTCLHFVSAMHEVFLDEFLMHGQLRSFLKLIDSFNPPNDLLCMSQSGYGDVGILLEVIFCHFSLSVSDNQDLEDFLNRLFCVETQKFRPSSRHFGVSPNAATVLLHIPIILSAPEFMQAHIIGLVSKAFSYSLDSENLKPDCQLMSFLLTVLEKSVVLYTKNIHNLQPDRNSKDILSSSKGEDLRLSFESFILPDTRNQINSLIAKLNDRPESYLSNMANKRKTGIFSTAISYVKECQEDVFDKSFQDEIFSILTRVVTEASENLEYAAPDASIQSICILAAVLKLMSTVLLRAVSFLRYNGDPNQPKCLSDIHLCKDYDILASTIGCFRSSGVRLPVQHFLCNLMKTSSTKHENSRMMFLHFSGLLSQALNTGLDSLVKGSLSVLMALMNLFVFEEGNLNVFCQLYASSSEPAPSGLPSVGTNETCTKKKYSRVVASKFLRTRTLYSRSCKANCSEKYECESSPNVGTAQHHDTMDSSVPFEEQTEEKSHGELYLNCILKPGKKVPDFDDLANFIECDPEKDYSKLIKNRRKFRRWKESKMDVLRWKRKKKTWRTAANMKTLDPLQRS